MTIRKYRDADLDGMIAIWNDVVEAGDAFPQEEPLTCETGAEFFRVADVCRRGARRKRQHPGALHTPSEQRRTVTNGLALPSSVRFQEVFA